MGAEIPSSSASRVLVPSSQKLDQSSEPPRKRRRIQHLLPDSDDGSDSEIGASSQDSVTLPQQNSDDYNEVEEESPGNQRSKYDAVIHEPAYVESQKNVFVTQIEQPWSSPSRMRGPRWRKKSPSPPPELEVVPSAQRPVNMEAMNPNIPLMDDFDDADFELLMEGSDLDLGVEIFPGTGVNMNLNQNNQPKNMRQTTLFGTHATQRVPQSRSAATQSHNWRLADRNEPPTHHKIWEQAMEKWIFPLNVGSIRDYQYNIVHKALFNNILVALPTGLGKTFIAATVMMNWYNWTKDAQIVFMAPTKPLVAQQIDACFHIAGIPRSQTTLMTGEIPSVVRAEEWKSKRVFFMTPQTMINDLKTGIADPKRIVLVVVDEAHKATGNYAYVEVVRFLRRFNNSFRVLGLTATPGASVEAVQKVIDGLDIARVEIRTEESLDIQAFVHSRNTELEYFEYSDEINMCLDLFSKAVKPVMDKLCSQNAYWGKDPTTITLYGLLMAQKQWSNSDAGRKANWGVKGMVMSCFKPLTSLAHNLELLKFHGIGPFYHKLRIFRDEASEHGKYAKMIVESEPFMTLMNRICAWIQDDNFVGHPKLEYLNSVVLNHFLDAGNGLGRAAGHAPSDTRIMIFAHYRDSAEEICRVLNRHQPMIRAHVFVGQSNTKGSEGMDQKAQTQIIKQFKDGIYNTLVATSIGEEGLDIGEVDLIVCYDCSKSPIRMLQRMGRTGRKRAGNIVMLLMRGKEEKDYISAKDNYQKMQELIESGKQFTFHDDQSPRIIPKHIVPAVSKERIEIPIENTQPGSVEPKKSKGKRQKKPPKRFNMPDNVEKGFKFLGKNKEKAVSTPDVQKRRRALDDNIVNVLADSEVLLTVEQEAELDERYASIAGDEEQYIQLVTISNQPYRAKTASKVKLVKHSATTQRILHAFDAAHKSLDYSERPCEPSEDDLNLLYGTGVAEPREIEEPFYVSQTEVCPVASQLDELPELENLFGRSALRKEPAVPRRLRRQVVSDEEDN